MKSNTLLLQLRTVIIVLLVTSGSIVFAQVKPLPSAVFKWEDLQTATLKGTTKFFNAFEVDVVVLKPGKKGSLTKTGDFEELLIIKSGRPDISLEGIADSFEPGSVALALPQSSYTVTNKDSKEAVYYRLRFNSKKANDLARGLASGGSFAMHWDPVVAKENERGSRRDFFNRPSATTENFEMHVSTLNEGLLSHPPHTHEAEEIILLIQGEGTMSIDNKEYVATAGDLVFLASGSLHGIRNSGKGQCTYFAFQWR